MAVSKFDYIGTGWSFPPVFDRTTGQVEMVDQADDINQSLWILLNTAKGERVMLPDYGCDLKSMLFEPLSSNNITYIKDLVQDAINLYESRIIVNNIDLSTAQILQGTVQLTIQYTIRATNSRLNIVFPFYQNEATEMGALGF